MDILPNIINRLLGGFFSTTVSGYSHTSKVEEKTLWQLADHAESYLKGNIPRFASIAHAPVPCYYEKQSATLMGRIAQANTYGKACKPVALMFVAPQRRISCHEDGARPSSACIEKVE